MRAATDVLLSEGSEPALDLVQPGCRGGSEVHVKPGVSGKPCPDGGGLVRAVVVNAVRLQRGTVSAIMLEHCPPSAWNRVRHGVEYAPSGMSRP